MGCVQVVEKQGFGTALKGLVSGSDANQTSRGDSGEAERLFPLMANAACSIRQLRVT